MPLTMTVQRTKIIAKKGIVEQESDRNIATVDDGDTAPLAVSAAAETALIDTADDDVGGEEDQNSERVAAKHESNHHIGDVDLSGGVGVDNESARQDGNFSIVSGMSSITGDHHAISDVEEEEDEDPKEGGGFLNEQEGAATAPPFEIPEENETDEGKKEEASDDPDPLVETLSQMGFEKEQIEKAIDDLKESGETEIDADSVIGSIAGENNRANRGDDAGAASPRDGINSLSSTWNFVESTVQDLDDQHELRRRTRTAVRNIHRSARDLWSNVQSESQRLGSNIRDESQRLRSDLRDESERFRANLRETCDQADVRTRDTRTKVRSAASNAKESFVRANEEYRITEKVATVAVVGGATLLVLGNPRAGVGAMAVAGATLAAGEAMKNSSSPARGGGSTYARDYGPSQQNFAPRHNEDLHLD
eukprot:191123_1